MKIFLINIAYLSLLTNFNILLISLFKQLNNLLKYIVYQSFLNDDLIFLKVKNIELELLKKKNDINKKINIFLQLQIE